MSNSFTVPDTPLTRRLSEMHAEQRSRRDSTQRILFNSPTLLGRSAGAPDRAAPSTSTITPSQAEDDKSDGSTHYLKSVISDPRQPEILFDEDATDSAAFNSFVIDAMFTGSSRTVSFTSEQVFLSTLAAVSVPDEISSLKTVKVSAILAFVEKICAGSLEMAKHVLKLDCSGDVIRSALRAISVIIRTEYKAVDFPDFIAQIALQLLSRSSHAVKIVSQFHRYMSVYDSDGVADFENMCAVGRPATINIDFQQSPAELPGYKRLMDDPGEWIRVTTALVDYAAFMSNSEIQGAYTLSRRALLALQLSDFTSVQLFADTELEKHSIFQTYAITAQRSDIDLLDRGLKMLQNLPFLLRKELDDYSRKRSIPENCMDRDWVVNELLRLEKRDQAVFSFWRQSIPEKPTAPAAVQSNKPAAPTTNHLPPTAALPVDADPTPMQIRGDPGASAPDAVQIKCQSNTAADCRTTFHASPSHWKSITTRDGRAFEVPKSCDNCRKHNKMVNQASLVTTVPTETETEEDIYSLAIADDDYEAYAFYASHDMTMSGN